jgi:ankyrin repeat protein
MIDVVEALLSDGSHDLNEIDALGFSPLHYAARHNRVDVTQRLLDCGAGMLIKLLSPHDATLDFLDGLFAFSSPVALTAHARRTSRDTAKP